MQQIPVDWKNEAGAHHVTLFVEGPVVAGMSPVTSVLPGGGASVSVNGKAYLGTHKRGPCGNADVAEIAAASAKKVDQKVRGLLS